MKSIEDVISREKIVSFRKGIKAAADLANDYNELSLHPYRLGDCILAQFDVRSKHPRSNKPNARTFACARELLREIKITDEALVQLARVIMPEVWALYVEKNGKVDEFEAWQCVTSLNIAKDVLAAGYRDCARSRDPIDKSMQKALRDKALASSPAKARSGAKKKAQRLR